MASLPVGSLVSVDTKHYGTVWGYILEDRGCDYRVLTPATNCGYTSADPRDVRAFVTHWGEEDRLVVALELLDWLTKAADTLFDLCGGEAPTEEDEHEWDKACQVMEVCARLRKDRHE